jgi:hypothetical protein
MNYYEKGGQAHGLKAIAQELQSKGRGGDTTLAHINPEEARMLKAMGGSGTINPNTGLPEFFKIGNVFKPITNAVSSVVKGATDVVKAVVQPVYNATLKQIPGVDKALVGLDKAVGKAIPGGWGTVASVAASFIPGGQLATMTNGFLTPTRLATGLGALSGSGVMRKGNNFDLQGAIMGGAMAYGASQLTQGLQNAAEPATTSATKAIEEVAKAETGQIAANLGVQGAGTGAGSQAAMLASQNAGMGAAGLESIKGAANTAIQSNLANAATNAAGSAVGNAAGADVFSGLAGTQGAIPPVAIPQPTGLQALGTNLTEAGKGTLSNIADAGQGIKNLTGFGSEGISGISKAASAFAEPVTTRGLAAGFMGYAGMSALEEQRKYLDSQLSSGAIGQAEYDTAKAKIDEQIETAKATVAANPLQTRADISNVSKGESLYDKGSYGSDTLYDKSPYGGTKTMYAEGGQVATSDDQTGMLNRTPLQTINAAASLQDYKNMQSPFQSTENTNLPYDMSQIPVSQGAGGQGTGSSPQSYYGGSGLGSIDSGKGGTFPLEGQYGIVKMAAGGKVPGYFMGGISRAAIRAVEAAKAEADKASGADIGIRAVKNSPFHTSANIQNIANLPELRPNDLLYRQNTNNSDFYDLDRNDNRRAYAAGGMAPRFLSGGGDGMSDSIKAKINGTQEARLADGEFVIPADVVSHIGNGSSKAGAKQLYSMMDRVRQARVGTKKQGKQINPRKYMAA